MAAARQLAKACLADPVEGQVDALLFPENPADPYDWTEESIHRERGTQETPILTPGQTVLALAALHAVYCPGCEPVLSIPVDVQVDGAEGRLIDEYRQGVRWLAIRDRVRKLGDYAAHWFRLRLPRFEQALPTVKAKHTPPAASKDAETREQACLDFRHKEPDAGRDKAGAGVPGRPNAEAHSGRPPLVPVMDHLRVWYEFDLYECESYGRVGPESARRDLHYRPRDGHWFIIDPATGKGHSQHPDQVRQLFREAGRPLPNHPSFSPTTTTPAPCSYAAANAPVEPPPLAAPAEQDRKGKRIDGMSFSKADAEALRDAIQDLLFSSSHAPKSMNERKKLEAALQTIVRLATASIRVPGEDPELWSFRLRRAALEVYGYATNHAGEPPVEELKHLQECQDTLLVIPIGDAGQRAVTESEKATRAGRSEGSEPAGAIKEQGATEPNGPPPEQSGGNNPVLPSAIRNWLVAQFLADPTPTRCRVAEGFEEEPLVFVPFEAFAGYLTTGGLDVLSTLKACRHAGWTHDTMVELKETADPSQSPPHGIARLHLSPGRHRLVAIRSAVLTPPAGGDAAPAGPALLPPPGAGPPPIGAPPAGNPHRDQEAGQAAEAAGTVAGRVGEPVEVFCAYSHKDERLRNQLASHLSPLRREGLIDEWHDRKIPPGKEWDSQIDNHLNAASVILLLISPEFIESDYCHDVEVKRALERHGSGEARVIPIILRPVDWTKLPFSKLQALPKDAKPVTKWRPRDEAWLDVASGIRKVVEELRNRA